MNKKAMSLVLIISLIGILLALAVGIGFYYSWKSVIKGQNIEVVKNWVTQVGAKQAVFKGLAETGRPPVPDLGDPIEIKTVDDLKKNGNKKIAYGMYDCARAFHFGETNFLSNIDEDVFCFPCFSVIFSDEIKQGDYRIIGLNRYMEKNRPYPGGPTFAEHLRKINPRFFEKTLSEAEDQIPIKDNMYIYFLAAEKKYWEKVAAAGIGTGILTGAAVGTVFTPGIGTIVGAGAGLVTGVITFFVTKEDFNPTIVIGDYQTINTICNIK